jgi:hypothetical protein
MIHSLTKIPAVQNLRAVSEDELRQALIELLTDRQIKGLLERREDPGIPPGSNKLGRYYQVY